MDNFVALTLISIFQTYLKIKNFFKNIYRFFSSFFYYKKEKEMCEILRKIDTGIVPSYLTPFLDFDSSNFSDYKFAHSGINISDLIE